MEFRQSFTYKESKIFLVENKFSVEELQQKLTRPEFYNDRFNKINSPYRQKEFLAIRYALKLCLGDEEKEINYSPDGKPSLKDGSYKISFSHSKDWVAVIAHPYANVGIDVEKPSERLVRVRKKFLHKEELEYYNTHKSLDYLCVVWSAKETLYKVIGETAYNFSEQLVVEPFEVKKEGEIITKHLLTNKKYKVHYQLNDFLTLAFCIENE